MNLCKDTVYRSIVNLLQVKWKWWENYDSKSFSSLHQFLQSPQHIKSSYAILYVLFSCLGKCIFLSINCTFMSQNNNFWCPHVMRTLSYTLIIILFVNIEVWPKKVGRSHSHHYMMVIVGYHNIFARSVCEWYVYFLQSFVFIRAPSKIGWPLVDIFFAGEMATT